MNNQVLQAVDEEKDLGVIFTKDLKPSKQCTAAAAARDKANRVLGLINRALTFKNKADLKNPYKALVRSAGIGPFP